MKASTEFFLKYYAAENPVKKNNYLVKQRNQTCRQK